jgi:diguanylate cyclase (GGDEF)-like protein
MVSYVRAMETGLLSEEPTTPVGRGHAVPPFALVASVASLAIPVAVAFWFPDWTSNGLGILIWLSALIPTFLLAYYRGWRGVAVALAAGMAAISTTQAIQVAYGITEPNWALLSGILVVFVAVAFGISALSELLIRERRKAQAMSFVDPLTQLPSRPRLEMMLTGEVAAAERRHRTLSVVVFALDDFKKVNSQHGPGIGDQRLQAFAMILRANTRVENLSARVGGNRFITVLRETSAAEAKMFAMQVLYQMRSLSLQSGPQSVSAGIAEYERGTGSYELLIGAADLALARAREAGGDGVVVAPKVRDTQLAAPQPVAPAEEPPAATAWPPITSAVRVWIVNDAVRERRVLTSMLERGDCLVWDTGNPLQAVQRFEELSPDARPHVILTDVLMPEMSGIRMIDAMNKIGPAVRVIYITSGHVGRPTPSRGMSFDDDPILQRPVTQEALLAALQRVTWPGQRPVGQPGGSDVEGEAPRTTDVLSEPRADPDFPD